MELDWSSFSSALIGALAGLGGVWLAQRSERKKAHADRVWAERVKIYQRLYQHVDEYETWCFDIQFKMADSQVLIRPAKTAFTPEDKSQLALFGSREVNRAYEKCWPKMLDFGNWWANHDEIPVTAEEKEKFLDPVKGSTQRVKAQITRETRGDD